MFVDNLGAHTIYPPYSRCATCYLGKIVTKIKKNYLFFVRVAILPSGFATSPFPENPYIRAGRGNVSSSYNNVSDITTNLNVNVS